MSLRRDLIARLLTALVAVAGLLLIQTLQTSTVYGQAETTPTPRVNRLEELAEPTLPPDPGQADLGAQAYWLHCMPCHGQRGQGLTDEFRDLYPPEDQNCWNSRCHGDRPYQDGFTLPKMVPPLIGPGALQKFETAANLFGYMNGAMPFQAPGSLETELYWQITAYLLRSNDLALGSDPLGPENALKVRLRPEATLSAAHTPSLAARDSSRGRVAAGVFTELLVLWGIATLLLGGLVFFVVWRARR